MESFHAPVLLEEVLAYLNPQPGNHYIDATADGGGHTVAILKAIQPGGKILAIEWDEELFQLLRCYLHEECSPFSKNYALCQASFTDLARCARSFKFRRVAGVLFDFGLSSFHLEVSKRGFSFQRDEPLDMRYSTSIGETAAGIIGHRSLPELEAMLRDFGGERFAPAIARKIVARRREHPIRSTRELVAVLRQATPRWYQRSRLHFATRTFQALRIAVNSELENIPRGLAAACRVLAPAGRIVTIAFHSLEDRMVKNFFKRSELAPRFRSLLSKPLRPTRGEVLSNPRARSAVLRAFEKIA